MNVTDNNKIFCSFCKYYCNKQAELAEHMKNTHQGLDNESTDDHPDVTDPREEN